jgi:hypothetical protein
VKSAIEMVRQTVHLEMEARLTHGKHMFVVIEELLCGQHIKEGLNFATIA